MQKTKIGFPTEQLIPEGNLANVQNDSTISADLTIFFNPFSVHLQGLFETSEDAINAIKEATKDDPNIGASLDKYINKLVKSGKYSYVLKKKARDTSLGGNDAINCYPQFHEDDDIVPPYNRFTGHYSIGLGRVYSESIDDKQQIMWMTFGVPQFTNLKDFFSANIDSQLAKLMNNGEFTKIEKISRLIGTVIGTVIALPVIPIKWFMWFWESWQYPVTKFYDLKASMPLYYKLVNSILAHLAVNMGITEIDKEITKSEILEPKDGGSINVGTGYTDFGSVEQNLEGVSASDVINDYGLDVLSILSKRDIYDGLLDKSELKHLDDHIEELKGDVLKGPQGAFSKFVSGFTKQMTRSMDFVGIRIEKSVDSSESLSNQTGEPEIAQMVNSKISSARSKMVNMAMGNLTGTAVEKGIKTTIGAIKDVLTGALSSITTIFGITDPAGALSTFMGSGYFDFPEVYQSSSFSKSYNFRMKLRSIYGDPISIFYNLYFPLAFIMAGAFPRAIGKTVYTSPFVIRAYARGKYAIPLGMIDSLTITRGENEYGWSYDHLPLALDITFSIKDLSPIMYIAIQSDYFRSIFGNNSSFQEYMLTLSGVGLEDRILFIERLKRRIKTSMKILTNNALNPTMLGYTTGNMRIAQMIGNFWPISKLPDHIK